LPENEDSKGRIYSGPILVLGIVQLIESIAFSIPFAYFPDYARSLGSSDAMIGLFLSSFMVTQAVLSPRIGGLSDRIGRKKLIMWGILGDVVLGIFTGLAPNWIWLLLIRAINGGVSAAAMIPAEALLIDLVSPKKRGEASGFVNAMWMVGNSLGPLFGGTIQWAAHSYGFSLVNSFRFPYFVDSSLAFLALILVFFKIREPKRLTEKVKTRHLSTENNNSDKHLSLAIKILLGASFVAGIGLGFILPVSALFYKDRFGIEYLQIGSIFTVTGFIGILAGWFAGRLSDKIGRKPLIGLGGYAARICGIALPLTSGVNQAITVATLRSVSFNVSHPALMALRADIVPARSRGRIFGMINTAFMGGMILGPITGTWLYSLYSSETLNVRGLLVPGYGIPFFFNAFLGLIATSLILLFVNDKQRTRNLASPS
jgi:MFS family permease